MWTIIASGLVLLVAYQAVMFVAELTLVVIKEIRTKRK